MRRLLRRFMHGRINPSPPPPPGARASRGCPLTLLLFPLSLRSVRCCHLQVPELSTQQASHSARIKIKKLRHRLSCGMNSLTGSRVGRFQSSEESYLTIKNILMGIFCVKLTCTQEKGGRTISSEFSFLLVCFNGRNIDGLNQTMNTFLSKDDQLIIAGLTIKEIVLPKLKFLPFATQPYVDGGFGDIF